MLRSQFDRACLIKYIIKKVPQVGTTYNKQVQGNVRQENQIAIMQMRELSTLQWYAYIDLGQINHWQAKQNTYHSNKSCGTCNRPVVS